MQTESETATEQLPILNIAAYKFVALDNLDQRRRELRELCRAAELKGTILLTPEGINLFMAGSATGIERLLTFLRHDPCFADLEVKESWSAEQPFERMLVKIKSEIITFGVEGIAPAEYTSKKLAPRELKAWLDEGRDVVLLDTRNDYEVKIGTFKNALPIGVDHFRKFPEAVEHLPEELRERPIVMFCTGGIRCEKAGPMMEAAGFHNIYQLEGGILKYFEEVGGDHYHGECFVFDKRVALDPQLQETQTTQCYACLAPLTVEDQASPHYYPPHVCPHCYVPPEMAAEKRRQALVAKLHAVTHPLPGSVPYDNVRPLNVPERFDGSTLIEFLVGMLPHLGRDYWEQRCAEGRIQRKGAACPADMIVRAGNQFVHLQPATVEPKVNGEIELLHEDDGLVVVNKPAPLPVHPCGRFHRNTLQWILNEVFQSFKMRPAHRLDAETTGVMVFCKTRAVSQFVQPQFEAGTVEKTYLARVAGSFENDEFSCSIPIGREPITRGGRDIDPHGLPAHTDFRVLQRYDDGTTLVRVTPKTGRTHQIRLHLWHLGAPICGDPLYLPDGRVAADVEPEPGGTLQLHCASLTFTHPCGERMTCTAPAPAWAVS